MENIQKEQNKFLNQILWGPWISYFFHSCDRSTQVICANRKDNENVLLETVDICKIQLYWIKKEKNQSDNFFRN